MLGPTIFPCIPLSSLIIPLFLYLEYWRTVFCQASRVHVTYLRSAVHPAVGEQSHQKRERLVNRLVTAELPKWGWGSRVFGGPA